MDFYVLTPKKHPYCDNLHMTMMSTILSSDSQQKLYVYGVGQCGVIFISPLPHFIT